MRLMTALIPLSLVTALAASPAFAAGSMQITGHGEVTAAPDTAYVTSGVTSQGATAKDALDANTKDMAALIATLKAAGIDSADIQTSGFGVNPNYVYSDQKDANGYQLPPKITGYTVTNGVTVHVRDLGKLGAVLDQAVTVGANTISGITFAARSASSIIVPRPGPSSTRQTGSGESMARHAAAAQSPISSPNIWLISGAVVKSPAPPNGSREQ